MLSYPLLVNNYSLVVVLLSFRFDKHHYVNNQVIMVNMPHS